MNIILENKNDASWKKRRLMVKQAIDYFVEYGGKMLVKVQKEYIPLLENLIKNITGNIKGIAFGDEVESLDMDILVNFSKKYASSKSNEIIAIKVKQEDSIYIYLAYSKDRQLLPISENKYLILKAKSLTSEVEGLFVESDLVILK